MPFGVGLSLVFCATRGFKWFLDVMEFQPAISRTFDELVVLRYDVKDGRRTCDNKAELAPRVRNATAILNDVFVSPGADGAHGRHAGNAPE